MSVNFGFSLPALRQAGAGSNPFGQLGPTLDLSFAGTVTDTNNPNGYTLNTNFITPEYQVAAQYAIWEDGVGLSQKTFSQIVTFTRASTGTYFNSAGTLTTAAINEARFDYNPSTLAAQGLLIEESRTNSIRNNTMVGAAAGTPGTLPTNWNVSGLGTLTQQVVGTGTVNGINYVDIRLSGTTSTTQVAIRLDLNNVIAAANGQTWAFSWWQSVVAGSTANLTPQVPSMLFYDAGAVFLGGIGFTAATFNSTSNFTRQSGSATIATANTAFIQPQINFLFASGVAIDITLRIGLPQLELGAFATSVIPTTTTALTRSADVANINTLSPWYNSTAGTVYAEFLAGASVATQQSVFDVDNSADVINNRISWRMGNEFVQSSGSVAVNFFITPTASATSKWALAFTTDDFAFSRNGGAPSTDTSGALPTGLNRLLLGNSNSAAGTFLNGYLRRITYYPRRLANADLQAITA